MRRVSDIDLDSQARTHKKWAVIYEGPFFMSVFKDHRKPHALNLLKEAG